MAQTQAQGQFSVGQGAADFDRIESVQQRAWLKSGSFALAPTLSAGLNDPFMLRGGLGARFSYWPRSLLGLSLEASAFGQSPTGASRTAQRELRARMRPGGSSYLFLGSLELAAVDGKVALASWIVPFELFLRGGAGIAGTGEDFLSEPGAAFALGAGIRWFAQPRWGLETALVWRSTAVHREVAARQIADRDLLFGLELSLPWRFGGAAKQRGSAGALSSLQQGLETDGAGRGVEIGGRSPDDKSQANSHASAPALGATQSDSAAPLYASSTSLAQTQNQSEFLENPDESPHSQAQQDQQEQQDQQTLPLPTQNASAPEEDLKHFAQNAAQFLPSPSKSVEGAVPLSQALAPLPPGQPPWELSLLAAGGLADPFWSKAALSASLRRRVNWLSVEGFGGGFFSWSNPALSLCTQTSQCQTSSSAQLKATPGRLLWMGGAGVSVRAAEGKVSLGGLASTWFSLHFSLGAAALGYQAEDGEGSHKVGPGSRAALALQSSLGRNLEARLELSHFLYASHIRSRWAAENQLLLGLGIAWRLGGGQ